MTKRPTYTYTLVNTYPRTPADLHMALGWRGFWHSAQRTICAPPFRRLILFPHHCILLVSEEEREISTMTTSTALVEYGSTGAALMIQPEQLALPPAFEGKPWHEKQWEALRPVWIRRIMSETTLQRRSVDDIVRAMTELIDRRFEERKTAKKERNKKRRRPDGAGHLNGPNDANGDGDDDPDARRLEALAARGCAVRVFNVSDPSTFLESPQTQDDIIDDLISEMARFGDVVSVRYDIVPATGTIAAAALAPRHYHSSSPHDDDHGGGVESSPDPPSAASQSETVVAVDVLFSAPTAAQLAVEATNGRMFDGRPLKAHIIQH